MAKGLDRRQFLKTAGIASAGWLAGLSIRDAAAARPGVVPQALHRPTNDVTQVAFIKTDDRITGVSRALNVLGINPVKGKSLFVKPNFNSAHAPPGSTHNDTLRTLITHLQGMGTDRITLGDRSGMAVTRQVMQSKQIFRMGQELGFETVVFDELGEDDWEAVQFEGSYWHRGFLVPRMVTEADGVVQTCCLKTHQYGGHFTLSLKNSVGLAAKYDPIDGYNYMYELHNTPNQRQKVAEVNATYTPDLILLDGVTAFLDGGPHEGTHAVPQVMLAGTDRVAIDAVGVAILRYFGTTPEVRHGSIFDLEQIARAVELGLGIDSPHKIELVTDDAESAAYAENIRQHLLV